MAYIADINKMADDYAEKYSKMSQDEKDGKTSELNGITPQTPEKYKLNIERIVKDNKENTACASCPHTGKCTRLKWNADHTFMKVTGCSQHPDQDKYPGHSTTVDFTDTSYASNVSRGESGWYWSSIRANAGTNIQTTISGTGWYRILGGNYIYRGVMGVDSSALPDEITIVSAKWELYLNTLSVPSGSKASIYSHDAITPNAADYNIAKFTGSPHSEVTCSDFTLSQYNDWDLDDFTGISKTGTTYMGFRGNQDIDNSDPSSPGDSKTFRFDGSGGTNPPKLSVTYDLIPPPDPPTDLVAVGATGQINLDWEAGFDGGSPITDYKIYEGSSSGSEAYLCNTGSTSTSYNRTGLGNNIHKFYKVKAVTIVGDSDLSNEADATTNPGTSQNDNYEYKLEVGAMSSENEFIYLQDWVLKNPKNRPMSASFQLVKTVDSLAIEVMDQVKFYRRVIGDTTWGDTLFFGRVTSPVYSTRGTVRMECKDYLDRIFRRKLSGPAFGTTHIVDKEFNLTCVPDGSVGYNERIYCDLGESDQMQVPFESIKVLQMKEYVSGGYNRGYMTAWTSMSDQQKIGQTFTARQGILRKIWFKGYRTFDVTDTVDVSIRADNDGVPGTTDITKVTLSAGNYGNGIANVGWIEVDLLRNVTDATKLNLTPGNQYWFIIKVNGSSGNLFYHSCVENDPTPHWRLCLGYNGSNWSKVSSKYCLLFGMDFEGDWKELAPDDYQVKTTNSFQRIYLTRYTWNSGDDEHFGNVKGYVVPEFLDDVGIMKFLRLTYWKGPLVFEDVVENWAYHLASDLFDTLDIDVTEPSAKCYCIDHKEGTGLQSWTLITNYAPYVIRLYMNEDGDRVLEIRDEKAPTTSVWNDYTTEEKAVRTFCHGFESPGSDDEVRIVDYEVAKELMSEEDTVVTRDAGGNVGGLISCGGHFSQTTGSFGSFAGNLGDGLNMANYVYESVKTIKRSGWAKLSGVNQTLADRPFLHSNELIKLTLADFGLTEEIMAVNMIVMTGGVGRVVETTLSFMDYIWTVKERSSAPSHGTVSNPGQSQESEKSKKLRTLADLESFTDYRPGGHTGASDCPVSSAPMRSDTRALQDGMALQDLNYEPDVTDFHRITLGTGTPTGETLGSKVCSVNADYPIYPFNENTEAIIMAYINDADLDPATSWPVIITEVGVESAPSETGPWTEAWAKSIAVDGTGDLVHHQPEMVPSRRLAVSIHTGVYIPT